MVVEYFFAYCAIFKFCLHLYEKKDWSPKVTMKMFQKILILPEILCFPHYNRFHKVLMAKFLNAATARVFVIIISSVLVVSNQFVRASLNQARGELRDSWTGI